jgi:hypothetical protein
LERLAEKIWGVAYSLGHARRLGVADATDSWKTWFGLAHYESLRLDSIWTALTQTIDLPEQSEPVNVLEER